ncbi:glycosyltransferase family 2 protein [Pleomassaria siparia CBS 279.74]|uniref:dolichyl-phosphate beta-glucosyltransferase n=1 Tax=Pleomassaria siparia CBS 279.74 TaxID=1314801 RepID=A0A6G1KQK1_9PLEO|nr:glycosyltransferase family 2 protein [Pleomassaria siparia CBS 279.74]
MDIYPRGYDGFDSFPKKAVEMPPTYVLVIALGFITAAAGFWMYMGLHLVAPVPRAPRPTEKQFVSILPDGTRSTPKELPCWIDKWSAEKEVAKRKTGSKAPTTTTTTTTPLADIPIDEAELFVSVVVPAYNEEERLAEMLEEAVAFLQERYGDAHAQESVKDENENKGWEIIIVSDGSTDKTNEVALNLAKEHQLSQYPNPATGPPHGSIRVVTLEKNRGKGGAVTHGMRHVRGQYVVFADADGASRFSDLEKLVDGCKSVEDKRGRGVAIGSRAHLVGSEAVVKRSKLRNFLMHSFHLLLYLLTPRATARIKDTQCGFKLFSRASLPFIIPYMHSEGWIFDVEMLMLAESAEIPMVEVAIGWKEVLGSKLNVMWDSLGMAWGLAILRLAWGLGVYSKE